jgi:anti-sigma regulatory factor (Ser/Thr protein kinase)
MHRSIFDFIVVGAYILLVISFGTIAALLISESVRLKSIDRRVARIAQVLLVVSLAVALDSFYWAFGMSGRIGFLPTEVGRVLYQSKLAFIPKLCLLISAFVLLFLLRKREIPELGRETEEGRRIRILHRITDSTTQSLDLAKMLQSAVPRTLELIGMEHASVYVRNTSAGALTLVASFGDTNGVADQDCPGDYSGDLSEAADAVCPTLQDARKVGRGKDWCSSTVCAPLTTRERSIGVLVLKSGSPRAFTHKDMDLLISVGGQLAVAVENAMLFEQNQSLLADVTKSANGLRQTVEERTHMLEQAQEQLGMAESHKRQFYKDTVLAVTAGKLVLVEPEELPENGMSPVEVCELSHKEEIGRVRRMIKQIATDAGMAKNRADNLVLAAGEAMTNALKHGLAGTVRIYNADGLLRIAIEDHGPGIDALTLPKATLLKGYSTKPSLGMGYALILELADKVYLCTGPSGTIVVLEMTIKEPASDLTIDIIPDTWGQF